MKETSDSGHLGFEVQDVHQDKDPLDIRADVSEMPHLDAGNIKVGGKTWDAVDLRIERYPVSQQEKQRLFRAFSKTGVVGELNGELIHFKPDSVEIIDDVIAKQLPRLPVGWQNIMKTVSENKEVPSMKQVFKRK